MIESSKIIHGFSKKTNDEKLAVVADLYKDPKKVLAFFKSFHHEDKKVQKLLEEFSENTISNFPLPYCIAPNFLINGKQYTIPMVIEESSVVAAASKSAKLWFNLGGFKTKIIDTEKIGQVHFLWNDDIQVLKNKFDSLKSELISSVSQITENMRKRGGGVLSIELRDLRDKEPCLMQLFCTFDTRDSMGANFINSCLEKFAETFKNWYKLQPEFTGDGLEIIMCILSNLTPNCRVKCWVETEINNLDGFIPNMTGEEFARRFYLGARIPEVDPYRATTHNKGIFNGIDSVILASGNDFRAIEACGHAYASRNGYYAPLSKVIVEDGRFYFEVEVPMSLGVVGGLTNLHPMVKLSLELLGHPSATELMSIASAVGLANNFSAIKSLVTTGIQEGHMKMHLFNIMNQLEIPENLRREIVEYFKKHKVSVNEVRKIYHELSKK